MNAIVIEHVPVAELPSAWPARQAQPDAVHVTVRIEEETQAAAAREDPLADPAFGMWRDHEDMADVEGYIRRIRAPRFGTNDEAPTAVK